MSAIQKPFRPKLFWRPWQGPPGHVQKSTFSSGSPKIKESVVIGFEERLELSFFYSFFLDT